jgi:hypothetical protein
MSRIKYSRADLEGYHAVQQLDRYEKNSGLELSLLE